MIDKPLRASLFLPESISFLSSLLAARIVADETDDGE